MRNIDLPSGRNSRAIFVRTVCFFAAVAALLATLTFWLWGTVRNSSVRSVSESLQFREDLRELAKGRRAAEFGDYETALQHAENAIMIQPESIAVNLFRSELLFRLHRTDEMREPLQAILRQNPDHFEAHANLAFSLRFCGMLDEAEAHVKWCIERRPDFLPTRRILAEILRDRGDSESALREIRKLILASPRDPDCHLLQAELLMYRREFELAYQNLLPLDEQFRGDHRFAATMARLCIVSGRNPEAAKYNEILKRLQSH